MSVFVQVTALVGGYVFLEDSQRNLTYSLIVDYALHGLQLSISYSVGLKQRKGQSKVFYLVRYESTNNSSCSIR